MSLDNGLKFNRKQRVWVKMDSKVQRGLKRTRLKGKSTSSTSDWSRLGNQDTRQVFEANPSMSLWTIGWSFKGKQNGLGSKIQRIKGEQGQIHMEHLWKVETAEVSRNLRTRSRPHVPVVIADHWRLRIRALLPRICLQYI